MYIKNHLLGVLHLFTEHPDIVDKVYSEWPKSADGSLERLSEHDLPPSLLKTIGEIVVSNPTRRVSPYLGKMIDSDRDSGLSKLVLSKIGPLPTRNLPRKYFTPEEE